ncbi:MAG: alpha/beta hydrolase [Marinilabiliales bacterium]|nr:MAG: alpha/beta hydrolase [Marinilabiliales bacterium]
MASDTIYKSPEGEKILMDIYDRQLRSLNIEYDSRFIQTRFGDTHMITAGNKKGKPVVIFHGGNSTNPYNLKAFLHLLKNFRIYAPDTIGHPGRSAQTVLSSSDNSYGEWAADVIGGIGPDRAGAIGISYGGGILARLAAVKPECIERAAFIVPSGIANSSLLSIIMKLGLPMIRYRMFPRKENLVKAVRPLINTDDIDEDTLEMVEAVFKHVDVKAEMPRNAREDELARFNGPVMVIAAGRDVMFPGRKVLKRAEKIFANLERPVLLDESSHMCFNVKSDRKRVHRLLEEFFN